MGRKLAGTLGKICPTKFELPEKTKQFQRFYFLKKSNDFSKAVELSEQLQSTLQNKDVGESLRVSSQYLTEIREIEKSDEIKISWQHYQIRYPYAANISFDDVFFVVKTLALSL